MRSLARLLPLTLSFALLGSAALGATSQNGLDPRVWSMLQKSVSGGPQQLQLAALHLQLNQMALTVKQPTITQARAYAQITKSLLADDYALGCLKSPTALESSDVSMYQAKLLGYAKNGEEVVRAFESKVADLVRKDGRPLFKYNCGALTRIDLSKIR